MDTGNILEPMVPNTDVPRNLSSSDLLSAACRHSPHERIHSQIATPNGPDHEEHPHSWKMERPPIQGQNNAPITTERERKGTQNLSTSCAEAISARVDHEHANHSHASG